MREFYSRSIRHKGVIRVLFPLKTDGFQPVLKSLGSREAVSNETIYWIVVVFAALLTIPVLAYRVRRYLRRRDVLARGFDQLQKVCDQKGMDPIQQATVERLAMVSPETNPSQVVFSIDGFDQAVRKRMVKVRRLPWLEMEQEIERISAVREKLGYRYIPEDRRPQNTRHMMIGQRIYILARGAEHFRLLSAPILGLDDLAILTGPLQERDQPVKLRAQKKLWAFYWSPGGGECRFGTALIKAYERPIRYLMFEHGDELVYNTDRKIFSCDLESTAKVDRISAKSYGRATLSEELFDLHEVDSLPAQLMELSASGFVVSPAEAFKMGDLIRLSVDDADLGFLNGWPARVVNEDGPFARCRFLKMSRENLETILHYVTPRISKDALKGRSRKRTVTQTT